MEVCNLAVGYCSQKEKNTIASDINFAGKTGELIGLIGANGIGKSTLLRTICKMQLPLSGTMFLDKKPLESYNFQSLSEKLSVVLTEKPVSARLTVAELVALGRHPYTNWAGTLSQEDKKHVQWAMQITQTDVLQQQNCASLSDGQLQSVMIARALAQNTPVIVLDEPTTHLDLHHRVRILQLLKKMVSTTGKTILFSTHEVELALQVCNKLLVMFDNQTVFDTPENLINRGVIAKMFPKDLLYFDSLQKKFIIKNETS